MQILTVSHPSPSKKRYVEPVVASDAPEQVAHQQTAPPEATLLRMRQAKSLGCIHSRRRPRGLLIVRRARSSGRRPLCHAAAPIPAQMPCARRCSRRVGARKLWLRFAGRASEDTRCGLPPSPRSQGHSGGLLRSLRPARHRQLAAVAQPPPGTKTNDALPESTP